MTKQGVKAPRSLVFRVKSIFKKSFDVIPFTGLCFSFSQDKTGCTQLSSVVLEYRLSGASTWTTVTQSVSVSDREVTIQLQRSGIYEVRLRVTNAGGVTAETQPNSVGVADKHSFSFAFSLLQSPIHLLLRYVILICVPSEPLSSEHAFFIQSIVFSLKYIKLLK